MATNRSSVKNSGEKRIVGYVDGGEAVSMRAQRADVKKGLCSVHKVNLGGNVVVLDGEKCYVQNKAMGSRSRINYEEGRCVVYLWLPSMEEGVAEESANILEAIASRSWPWRVVRFSPGGCTHRKSA